MIAFPKRKRLVDEDLLSVIRDLPCMACFIEPCGEVHHITTVGAGGDDVPENCIPLCHRDHMLWHQKGARYMIDKYPGVLLWLEGAGRRDVLERATEKGGTHESKDQEVGQEGAEG